MSGLIEAYKLLPGMLLASKYRLHRKIGQGAMGVVWAATNEATGREVALKVIARPDPSLRKRLLREAQSCGALQHPNIVDVIDVARTESGEPCLIMEMLVGESVAALLEARRRLDAPLAARIARDVAGALAAAHAVQIVHRDLKPANLFLHRPPEASDFVVKVLDFGVAKNLAIASGATSTLDAAVGTPFYMSPEQVRADRDIDPRADLWALGVVLFEMLTGVRPFQGDGTQLISQILEGEIPKVSRYLRRVDERLVRIVDRCLRRAREERFASAEEVARELAVFVPRGAGMAGGAGVERAAAAAERWEVQGAAGEGAEALPETVARQDGVETAVAPTWSQGASVDELATTVPVARSERESGGGKTAAGQGGQAGVEAEATRQGLHAASAVSGWGGRPVGGEARFGGPGAGEQVGGASSAGMPTGAPVADPRPVVTHRGTVVMRDQLAVAQQRAVAAIMDAAREQAKRGGAPVASAQPAAKVASNGEARRERGKSRTVDVVVTLAVGLIVGALVAVWIGRREQLPAAPVAVDGGGALATDAAAASARGGERSTAAAKLGASSAPEQTATAVAGAPAEVGDTAHKGVGVVGVGEGEGRDARAGQAVQVPQAAPQGGAKPPAPAATTGQGSVPSRAAGMTAATGERALKSGERAGPAKAPPREDEVYGAPAARSTAPAGLGAPPGEAPATERKSAAPPRPF
ncbi:protein kinase [Sorangium sp. So ce448]|uniref:serine/threonine-protein kinase n=1 Tax=Sorangium sp. So ce448 TaxID=3133314 RepID=UPI003F5F5CE7